MAIMSQETLARQQTYANWSHEIFQAVMYVVRSLGVDANILDRYADINYKDFVQCFISLIYDYRYLKQCGHYPTLSVWGYTNNTFREVQAIYRWIQYEVHGVQHWDHAFLHPDWKGQEQCRWFAAARIHRARECSLQGINPYLVEGRYQDLQTDRYELLNALPASLEYLVDESFILPLELHSLMIAVHETSYIFHYSFEILETLARGTEYSRVQDITKPWTEQAMASSDNISCNICLSTFSPIVDPKNHLEPAVLTNCNHILGAVCLQKWINSNHNTCPTCRRPLHIPGSKPIPCENLTQLTCILHDLALGLRVQFRNLDSQIDAYVLLEPRDVYGPGMKKLLDDILVVHKMIFDVATMLEGFRVGGSGKVTTVRFFDQ